MVLIRLAVVPDDDPDSRWVGSPVDEFLGGLDAFELLMVCLSGSIAEIRPIIGVAEPMPVIAVRRQDLIRMPFMEEVEDAAAPLLKGMLARLFLGPLLHVQGWKSRDRVKSMPIDPSGGMGLGGFCEGDGGFRGILRHVGDRKRRFNGSHDAGESGEEIVVPEVDFPFGCAARVIVRYIPR